MAFDLKVHHKDKKGRLYKITPYRRVESKTDGVWYERNGMRYAEDGTPLGMSETCPRALQCFEIEYETQGVWSRPVYKRIANPDTPDHLLTLAQTAEKRVREEALKSEELKADQAEVASDPIKRGPGRPRKVDSLPNG